MMELSFLCEKKILVKLKRRTIFALMFFVMKVGQFFQSTFKIKDLKTQWICCLYLMKTSHRDITRDFNRFMFHKTKNKNKKYFCKSCLQCFSSKNVLAEHKKVCLNINGAQSVRFEKGAIKFKIYFK